MYSFAVTVMAPHVVQNLTGVEEEFDGDREEADGAHGPRRGLLLPRRAALQSHRDLQPVKLPVHFQL